MSTAPRTTPRIFSSSCAKARWAHSEHFLRQGLASTQISARARTWGGFERISWPPSPLPSPSCGGRRSVGQCLMKQAFEMITSDRTRFRTNDPNQPVTMCQFVSMFAKARRAQRKRRQSKELRQASQWRAWRPGHKKTLSVGEYREMVERSLARQAEFAWMPKAGQIMHFQAEWNCGRWALLTPPNSALTLSHFPLYSAPDVGFYADCANQNNGGNWELPVRSGEERDESCL